VFIVFVSGMLGCTHQSICALTINFKIYSGHQNNQNFGFKSIELQ
jgi:hypothetical protein